MQNMNKMHQLPLSELLQVLTLILILVLQLELGLYGDLIMEELMRPF